MQDIKQEILAKLSLESLIGESVSLQKRGHISSGLCPFHEENTPSFYVYPDHYHCYGCGEHGDIINFARKSFGLSFVESLKWLSEKAGIPFTMEDKSYSQEAWKKKSRESKILLTANEFFQSYLKENFHGHFARKYLEERQIPLKLAEDLGMGYAPAFPDYLWKHFRNLGYKAEELSSCSLINITRDRVFDFFQNRLILPIRDEHSRIIAFAGRSLGDEQPKYKNSRFEKASFLLGLDRARTKIRQKSRALIVEGPFDAVQMWNYGFEETVACQGTALSQEHLRKLSTFAKTIILLFDGDNAGKKAALKVLDLSSQFPELHLKIAPLKAGEDPDSFLREHGRESLEDIISQSQDLFEFAIEDKLQNAPQASLAETIRHYILPWIQEVRDPIRKALLTQKIADKTGIRTELLQTRSTVKSKKPLEPENPSPAKTLRSIEKEFLGHLFYSRHEENPPLDQIEKLIKEDLELPQIWSDFARELLSFLKDKKNPEELTRGDIFYAQNKDVQAFLDSIQTKKTAFQSQGKPPFERLEIEAKKISLKLSIEQLKREFISLKMHKNEDPQLWKHLTNSLIQNTHTLENLEKKLRKELSP